MSITVRLLDPAEAALLAKVAPDVFDEAVSPQWAAEFCADPRHHLAVALDGATIVGMASAVHYVHPDKAPELWINEVGVADSHQRRGLGRQLLAALLAHGRALNCGMAWVLTNYDNTAARQLYAAAGGVEDPNPVVMIEFPL